MDSTSRFPGPLDVSMVRPRGGARRSEGKKGVLLDYLFYGSLLMGSPGADHHPPLKGTSPAHNSELSKILNSNLGFQALPVFVPK